MRVKIVEHKTSSEDITPGSSYWQKLTLDSQLNTYLAGARSMGHEPTGILYDVAKRPALRPYLATPEESRKYTKATKADPVSRLYANMREQDETVEEFRTRLRADISESPDKYYRRGDIVRLAGEEAAAARNTWIIARWIREVQLESAGSASGWPQNVDACHAYNSACEFWGPCSGQLSIDDPYLYTRTTEQHTELENDGKRRLPLVTTSSMKTFRSCPRKYFYRYEMGYRSASTSEALRFGTLFHLGLEEWWKTRDIEGSLAAVRAGVSADAYELVRAEELLLGYHFRWEDDPHEVVSVEAQFETPLINPTTGAASKTWSLAGRIDAIISDEVLEPATSLEETRKTS